MHQNKIWHLIGGKLNFIKKYYEWFTGLFVFLIYLITVAPSVVQIDNGELAAVQITLGIAHPTGYPLFTMLGYLWNLVPLPLSSIFQANLFSSITTSIAVVFFIKLSVLIFSNNDPKKPEARVTKKDKRLQKKEEKPVEKIETNIVQIISILGGLFLAFNRTFWEQSTSLEVYPLHLLLIISTLYFLLKSFFLITDEYKISLKIWLYFSLILALAFSNHMTTLLILPGTAYLFFVKERINFQSLRKLGYMLAIFFPVLALIYSYLPFRAFSNPIFNWGNPVNFENFWRHVSGKQYRVWLFSSSDAAKKHLTDFISQLPDEFAYIGLIPILFGIGYLITKKRKTFVFLLITSLFTVFYSINYDIHDINSYFLLAYISLAIFGVGGFLSIIKWLETKKLSFNTISAICTVFILVPLILNFPKVNKSGTFIFEDYTKTILSSVEENSLILSYQWDYWVSPSFYYQYVEGYRPDVKVVDKELLRRSWYFNQLERNYPGLLNGMEEDLNGFLKALLPFERSENYNSSLLESYYRKIMQRIVTDNYEKYDSFIGPELFDNEYRRGNFPLPEGYNFVPYGLLYKIVKGTDYEEAPELELNIRFPEEEDEYSNIIKQTIINVTLNRAIYELNYEKKDKARVLVAKIQEMFPAYPINQQLLKRVNNN